MEQKLKILSKKDALAELLRVLDIYLNGKFSDAQDKEEMLKQVKVARDGYYLAEREHQIKREIKKEGVANGTKNNCYLKNRPL